MDGRELPSRSSIRSSASSCADAGLIRFGIRNKFHQSSQLLIFEFVDFPRLDLINRTLYCPDRSDLFFFDR